jgi:hypothetical protein
MPSDTLAATPETLVRHQSDQRRARARTQPRDDARVPHQRAVQLVVDEPVLGPAGDQGTGKQQHTGKGGKEDRRTQQRQAVQHIVRFLLADQGCTGDPGGQQLGQQDQRSAQRQVADNAGCL